MAHIHMNVPGQNGPIVVWLYPSTTPAELPIGLNHMESDLCWCDPIVEIDDEDGKEVVLHRQVTWN